MDLVNKNNATILEQLSSYNFDDTEEYLLSLKETFSDLKELNNILKNKDYNDNITYVKDFIAQNKNSVNHQLDEINSLTKNIYDICNENKELENEKQEYKDLINSSECIEIANKLSEIKKVKENLKFFLSKKGIFLR